MRYKTLLAFLALSIGGAFSQSSEDERIAIQFYQFREYDKAELLLEKQHKLKPQEFYPYLYNTYMELRKFESAIDITRAILKGKNSKNKDYMYNLGLAYYKNDDTIKAYKHWTELNDWTANSEFEVSKLLKKYSQVRQWTLIESLILKSHKQTKKTNTFIALLIDAYVKQGKYEEAVNSSIKLLDETTTDYMTVFAGFSFLSESTEAMSLMDKKVFASLNKDPNNKKWNDIAMHMSMTLKDYEQALMLAMAFEKRTGGQGSKIYHVSEIALSDSYFDIAIEGYDHLIGGTGTYAKLGYDKKLNARLLKLEKERTQDSIEIKELNTDFLNYFSKYGFSTNTADIQLLFAQFTVKHLKRLDNAMHILDKLLDIPMLSKFHISRGKLDLADVKLALNDIWEASLLYGQVDKDEKDSPLGEEARFKNSRVFYYNGDYELAEDLLSILKSSSTELIANDALQLAAFIQENVGDEAKELAMRDVSAAELYFYQNKPEEAFKLLRSLKKVLPNSELIDDVLLIEANYEKNVGNYERASKLYKEIFEIYPNSILSDRALYEWGIIEEEVFKKVSSAKDGYLQLLTKYKDSVFTTDARKRLRRLRGESETDAL